MEKQSLHPLEEKVAGDGDGEEEDEEMKMETFFALVRNFKEMRDRRREELMIGCDGDEAEAAAAGERKRKKIKTVQNRSTWIPKFEREDFDEDFQVRGPAKEETSMKKKTQVESREDCLDLNLAL